jgi:arabinose-5-phosphate isomerase
MTTREYAIQCIKDEAQAVLNLIPKVDENFDQAVELIMSCKGKVIVTGVGKSGHIGAKIAATLASTGTPSFFINPLDVYHGDLGVMSKGDVVLAISNSGQTDELLRFIPMVLHMEIPIIGMSGNPQSLLAKYSTCHLNISVEKEACPLNLAPTSSTTAAIAMGDALAIALMEMRCFKANDFAMFHPGGTLGRKLLVRVKDVMYTENFPIIAPDLKLSEAIMTISSGKLGLGVVMTGDRIVGIITDGDIRRAVQGAQTNFINLTVAEAMTHTPKTINPEAKLTKIQEMFNRYKIHSLLVVDGNKKLVGIVDYFAIMN